VSPILVPTVMMQRSRSRTISISESRIERLEDAGETQVRHQEEKARALCGG
jgi:hypothetical protein